jgi:hypothetical protein
MGIFMRLNMMLLVGSRPKWERNRAQRIMTFGTTVMGKKACKRKTTTGKKPNMCACKKEVTTGRKQQTHAEKEDLTTIVVRVLCVNG